jgi:serine/threonine-protein kinase
LTPLTWEPPDEGAVLVHLRKRGFQPVDRLVSPERFRGSPPEAQLSERLEAVAKGELTLNALPWAHVTIDGEKRADTPIQHLPLPAGPHQVRLVCPPTGHELSFTLVVQPGVEVRRLAEMRGEPHLVE